MGDIVKAECECGFKSKELFFGCARPWHYYIPIVCKRCGNLSMMNMYERKGGNIKRRRTGLICRGCKKRKTILNAPTLHRPSGIAKQYGEDYPWEINRWEINRNHPETGGCPEIFYFCPKCKEVRMRFHKIGIWD
jgi:hypothetical protein